MDFFIDKSRVEFLQANFNELSFKRQKPSRELFLTITSPTELHFIADWYNWDDGIQVLEWIIDSELCDEGTAKLIFWRAQPQDYTAYEKVEEVTYGKEVFLLIKKIIDKFYTGFYTRALIAYDPSIDADLQYSNPKSKWAIPTQLKEPTKGGEVLIGN